ncbi:PilN family type IVB pilus formation outer membrane protein [Pseudomonas protegens]|uniref:PilN family type IVB pilus formation outer membrane protein n=1 Tax=Pseudomonas protegens TaxID=380021 RepID=A0A2T6GBG5_9PSED|nr:PilN family type IVB pilus formation outer membrane protein [Pseudomonas protegens]PUA41490.1 PilN family type IVB pilus formation outer membrane protein [Pseudomonas protegens]
MEKNYRLLLPVLAVAMVSACAPLERIDRQMQQAAQDREQAQKHLRQMETPRPVVREAPRQWVNLEPLAENRVPGKAVPDCAITLNRQGAISLNEVAQRIVSVCGVPVTVTPDATMALGTREGGKTEQIQGQIPVPDANGMLPLASMGAAQAVPVRSTGAGALNGLNWSGSLSGLLDSLSSRLGLSWRYEGGKVLFYYLETRSFPVEFMDAQAEFRSRVVSGTTSTAGVTGGQSGNAIGGDSNTSQTTTMEVKASLYADLQKSVETMLTPSLGRMFLSAGQLTVTDSPQVLEAVERFVAGRNRELNRQVVLNVEVLNVESRNKDQLGIDWKAVFKNSNLKLSLTSAFTGAAENAMSGGLSIVDGTLADSSAFIRALSTQGRVSLVTKQASTTSNMTPLPMQVAEQEDYVAQVTAQSTANVGTATSIQPATITTGFNMTLLPYIKADGRNLQLQFSISLSDPPSRRTFTSGESSVELLNTKLKTVNQRVNLKSGQTIVLSGFQQTSRKADKQGVATPGFFGLGGGQKGEDGETMLVILITPIILGEV